MKFVHIADMHFDTNFDNLSRIDDLPEKRRLEQRNIFRKIIDYIKEKNIELLFISGDFYEQKYIRKSTIEYINKLFTSIPNTKIFISPGNHDPAIKNSFYNSFKWNENVYIFKNDIEKIELNNINIYGFGFTDFYCKNSGIEEIILDDKEKINVLVTHGSLDGGYDNSLEYNPLSQSKLKKIGFDYIALGHIHKSTYNGENEQTIIYPGSTISQGFDETGSHGMIVGNLEKNNVKIEFVELDDRKYSEISLNIEDCFSPEEIVEKIENLNFNSKYFYKIILEGKRNILIDTKTILKLINIDNILKIKDITTIGYNLEIISQENNIRGLFVKKMIEKCKQEKISKEDFEKAIEIGLEVL